MDLENWQIAILIRPFFLLVFFGLVLLPIRLAIQKWMPDGKLKRFFLIKIKD